MDFLPITMPAPPPDAKRPPVPFMAALVPVAGGVVMWLVSGSLLALCFAALGPLMVGASLIDGARARRKARRAAASEVERAWARVEVERERRHDEERELLNLRHPDAASALQRPPLRGGEGADAATMIVVGRGAGRSELRASGGDDERARAFQSQCAVLEDAPIAVALGGGVCLRGAAPVVLAIARGLVVQLVLRFGSAQLAIVGERASEWGLDGFVGSTTRRNAMTVGLARIGDPRPRASAVIWVGTSMDEVPEGVTTVVDVVEPSRASLRTPHGIGELAVEGLSVAQAELIARAKAEGEEHVDALPDAIALAELRQERGSRGVAAAIGRSTRDELVVDIVDDGPHAIVTGTTGTGKSELLVTWVTAMASTYGPDRVVFVLADFKGGTAFEPLRALPQVAAVITDLDDEGARRGVSSLTAELRRREAILAEAGVRDVRECDVPRLVIVVDEFAALLQEHADLGAVFTDIAARGRALGMHLIIGTQRASGVIRDALAANCPLRISLRVSDAADSRTVIGTDAAAELPGGPGSRGLALVRRPEDAEPVPIRVALTGAADLRAVGTKWSAAQPARSPWLPALSAHIPLEALPAAASGEVIIGQADEPERQRQPVRTLRLGIDRGLAVLGAAGTGRSSVLRLLTRQHPAALCIPSDPEAAWDAVADLVERRRPIPDLVLCDDIDALLADLPSDHSLLFAQRWEQLLRGAPRTTFVLTAARSSGAAGRLMDVLPQRALLRMPSRVEHLAAGGDSSSFDRDRVPGRAVLGEHLIQFAWAEHSSSDAADAVDPARWSPSAALTAVVTSAPLAAARAMQEAHPHCEVVPLPAEPKTTAERVILVADADTWQRSWLLWQRVRAQGEILIRAESPSDLRQLAGVRETPPFARTHAGRAWSLREPDSPRRVVLPELAPT
ncbi:MAG: FtsK/SpoIIIE domain-containing protein [Microbacterium sp.]